MADGKAGRPSKMTEEVVARLVEALEQGNFREVAARWAGISPKTLRIWMAKGRKQKQGEWRDFYRRVMEAEQSAEMAMVRLVMLGAAGDSRHAEWFLERKFPERWGRKERIEHTGKDGEAIQTSSKVTATHVIPEPEHLSTVLSLLAGAGALAESRGAGGTGEETDPASQPLHPPESEDGGA